MTVSVAHALGAAIEAVSAAPARIAAGTQDTLRLGVLDDRAGNLARAQWQPLVNHLNANLPRRYRLSLRLHDQQGLSRALERGQLDFVLTNPVHYLSLREANALSGPLLTLLRQQMTMSTSRLGAAVLTLDREGYPDSWTALQGASVGIVERDASTSYLSVVEALERLGIGASEVAFDTTPASQDAVIDGLLSGDFRAGVVRTGILEAYQAAGRLPDDAVRLLAPRRYPGFPFAGSTRLSPEWVVAARRGVPNSISKQLAGVLYRIDPDSSEARTAGIGGFTIPADYSALAERLADLRLPPFNQSPYFDVKDIWARYQTPIGVSASLAVLALALLAALIVVVQRKQRLQRAVSRSEREWLERFQEFSENVPGVLYQFRVEADGRAYFPFASARVAETHGCEAEDAARDASFVFERIEPADRGPLFEALDASRRDLIPWEATYRVNHPVHGQRWMRGRATPSPDPDADGGMTWHGYVQDVTELKASEAQQQLAASVFEASREGIIMTDSEHRVIKVNRAFSELVGYTADEMIGHLVESIFFAEDRATLVPEMIAALDQGRGSWSGEARYRTRSGDPLPVELTVTTVRSTELGSLHHVGVFRDMRAQLQHQDELERLASYDALTGLPNRRLLTDRLDQAIAQAQRRDERFAVCMLDLDGFKPINDRYGHDAGDQVLMEVGNRLCAVVRASDTVARLGGDEFVIVLRDFKGEAGLRRVLFSLDPPIRLGRQQAIVRIGGSLGAAVFDPAAPLDGDQLLRQADQAAYEAKREGGGRYARFTHEVAGDDVAGD